MFGWNCKGCGSKVCAKEEAVMICLDGNRLQGVFDGFEKLGRFSITESLDGVAPCLWHKRCWVSAGMPKKYNGPSETADPNVA
jgi:hypothetical protein